jgi:protein SCO1/2
MHRAHGFNSRRLRRHAAFILLLALFTALASCTAPKKEGRRYDLKGKVVSVDRATSEVTVDHEAIPGYMEAMTMHYPLRDADALKVLDAGDRLQATLVVADDGTYWLEDPFITKGQPDASNSSATAGGAEPQVGAEVPDVKLVNQDGKPVSIRQFKGRALLITFVYTRCPMPDQCPLMSANFAQVNGAIQNDSDLRKKAHLLSVTLDPEYDKPEILRSYGAAYAGGKFDDWDFATGDPGEVRRLAEFFGLMYQRDNGQLIHSLRTAVVTPGGKLYKIYRGNEWKPEEVLRDLKDATTKS